MEKIIDKIEAIIDNQLSKFDTDPIKTSFKFLFFYWLFKKMYGEVKGR